ncbi:hypothetical protein SAMN02787144_1005212 [Streptomyces atratus]|uniref:Xaa-Pro dipeptidyl-peptidase-like domain-containing protein n=1 Tax=Streptomyces atratus TaxID=1893 RepID=A0A1K1Z7W9_STRAR|nr:hypothetical protein SAMN02787144_1005212 [Streptomyces atratus]
MSRAVSRPRSGYRTFSRKSAAYVAGAALAAPLVLTGAARATAAEQSPYTVTPLKFTVQAGGRSCTVDADLYRPAGVDAQHPAPAVLAGTRAADDGTKADYVTRDGSGDPTVGMIGGSYGGAVQMATAAVDRRVDALVPLITWNDLAYALAPNNAGTRKGVSSDTAGVFKWQWTNGFYLMGEGQTVLNASLDPSRFNNLTCLHFASRACDTIRLLNSGCYPADRTAAMLAPDTAPSPTANRGRGR